MSGSSLSLNFFGISHVDQTKLLLSSFFEGFFTSFGRGSSGVCCSIFDRFLVFLEPFIKDLQEAAIVFLIRFFLVNSLESSNCCRLVSKHRFIGSYSLRTGHSNRLKSFFGPAVADIKEVGSG